MSTDTTIPATIATMMQGEPSERMSRKHFNSYLHELFECEGANDVTADEVHEAEDFYVEVFNDTLDGPMVAVHDAGQTVEIYRHATEVVREVA